MKTILCYGDSNTWGYNPATKDRFGRHERWTGVLRLELSEGFLVIEEGLNGRTTVWDDPMGSYRNGREYLAPCLGSHKPVDLVIIMLGTNALKRRFSAPACDVPAGAGILVDLVAASQSGPSSGPPTSVDPVEDCRGALSRPAPLASPCSLGCEQILFSRPYHPICISKKSAVRHHEPALARQQCLYFLPLPQGQGALRPSRRLDGEPGQTVLAGPGETGLA